MACVNGLPTTWTHVAAIASIQKFNAQDSANGSWLDVQLALVGGGTMLTVGAQSFFESSSFLPQNTSNRAWVFTKAEPEDLHMLAVASFASFVHSGELDAQGSSNVMWLEAKVAHVEVVATARMLTDDLPRMHDAAPQNSSNAD